jgi:hypothetical protein
MVHISGSSSSTYQQFKKKSCFTFAHIHFVEEMQPSQFKEEEPEVPKLN